MRAGAVKRRGPHPWPLSPDLYPKGREEKFIPLPGCRVGQLPVGKVSLFYPSDGMLGGFTFAGFAEGRGYNEFLDSADYQADVHQCAPHFSVRIEERNRGNMNRTCLKFVAAGLLICLVGGCAWLDPPCDNSCAGGGPNGAGHHAAVAGGGRAPRTTRPASSPIPTIPIAARATTSPARPTSVRENIGRHRLMAPQKDGRVYR